MRREERGERRERREESVNSNNCHNSNRDSSDMSPLHCDRDNSSSSNNIRSVFCAAKVECGHVHANPSIVAYSLAQTDLLKTFSRAV